MRVSAPIVRQSSPAGGWPRFRRVLLRHFER